MDSTYQYLFALAQVIMIDVTLAADNALVVGLAASRVASGKRSRVLFWGIAGAVLVRILLAVIAVQLLSIVGLTIAGGILLLWVCWKMARELLPRRGRLNSAAGESDRAPVAHTPMSFRSAIIQIIVADVSMSLDNVLAVAGAAKGSLLVLAAGLGLSIALMAIAATFVARLLTRHPWISWLGFVLILYVAVEMIWRGAIELGAEAGMI